MLAAHFSYYGSVLSISESKECLTTISQLQAELALRIEAKE